MEPNLAATPRGPKGEIRQRLQVHGLVDVHVPSPACGGGSRPPVEINTFLGYDRMSVFRIFGLSSVTCGIYGLYFMFVEGKKIIARFRPRLGCLRTPHFSQAPCRFSNR